MHISNDYGTIVVTLILIAFSLHLARSIYKTSKSFAKLDEVKPMKVVAIVGGPFVSPLPAEVDEFRDLLHGKCLNPDCEGGGVDGSPWDLNGTEVSQECVCTECGCEWVDTYEWSGRAEVLYPDADPGLQTAQKQPTVEKAGQDQA